MSTEADVIDLYTQVQELEANVKHLQDLNASLRSHINSLMIENTELLERLSNKCSKKHKRTLTEAQLTRLTKIHFYNTHKDNNEMLKLVMDSLPKGLFNSCKKIPYPIVKAFTDAMFDGLPDDTKEELKQTLREGQSI